MDFGFDSVLLPIITPYMGVTIYRFILVNEVMSYTLKERTSVAKSDDEIVSVKDDVIINI